MTKLKLNIGKKTPIHYKSLSQKVKSSHDSYSDKKMGSVKCEEKLQTKEQITYIPIDKLTAYHNQARKIYNETSLDALTESIQNYGIRQPLTITSIEDDKYEVVSGERRLRAAKKVGLVELPCIILTKDSKSNSIALVENLHREDLHPLELGLAYSNLLKQRVFIRQSDLSRSISVSAKTISEYIRYTTLPQAIQEHILIHNIRSRKILRELVQANDKHDLDRIKLLLSKADGDKEKQINTDFPILKIMSKGGIMQFQELGIGKLSLNDKKHLKKYLNRLSQNIVIEPSALAETTNVEI